MRASSIAASLIPLIPALAAGQTIEPIPLRPPPADRLYILYVADDGGMLESRLQGPVHLTMPAEFMTAVDAGGVSTREDIVVSDGVHHFLLDLDDGLKISPLSLPGLAPLGPLSAIQAVGSPRLDLVTAVGNALFTFDFDTSTWFGPSPTPVAFESLARVDLTGSPAEDLVGVADSTLYVRDLDPPGPWTAVPTAPPIQFNRVTASDLPAGPGVLPHLLVANEHELSALSPTDGQWSAAQPTRFRIAAAVAAEVKTVVNVPPARETVFLAAPHEETAIAFEIADASIPAYQYQGEGHSPGAVFADLDGDGFDDLYLVRSGLPNLLLKNQGDGTFADLPGAMGAGDPGPSTGAVAADYDNDGDLDLYVTNTGASNRLYRNAPGGFTDVTALTDPTPDDPAGDIQEGVGFGVLPDGTPLLLSLAAAFSDIDRDGHADLFVGNHRCCVFPDGERDVLYRSGGDGTFEDITVAAGIAEDDPPAGHTSTQACAFGDVDGDGWPDLYVTHKGDGPTRDQLFLNLGDTNGDLLWDGQFVEYFANQPDPMLGSITGAAMGIDFGDFDNDLDLDIFLTDINAPDHPIDLYENLSAPGAPQLAVAAGAGLAPPFAWGTAWFDADLDGDLDLQVASGTGEIDFLFRNDGGRLTDVALAAGIDVTENRRAVVCADYDRDGFVDAFVVSRSEPSVLYRNATGSNLPDARWLHVEVRGNPASPGPFRSTCDALGARVFVAADLNGDGRIGRREVQMREVRSGSHTCASTSSLPLEFGLGRAARAERVLVKWPSGQVTGFGPVASGRRIVVEEP